MDFFPSLQRGQILSVFCFTVEEELDQLVSFTVEGTEDESLSLYSRGKESINFLPCTGKGRGQMKALPSTVERGQCVPSLSSRGKGIQCPF